MRCSPSWATHKNKASCPKSSISSPTTKGTEKKREPRTGVDKVRGTKFPCPRLFIGIRVDGDDAFRAHGPRRLDDA